MNEVNKANIKSIVWKQMDMRVLWGYSILQITTILQGDQIKLIRSVNQNAQVVVNSDGSYTVILIQDGVSNTVKINGGTSSSITIIQTP